MPIDDTKQKLIEAAGKMFAEKGFDAASVREICADAGANIAAINYHFGDKRRLYVESIKFVHACRGDIPRDVTGTTPEQKLKEFIRTLLSNMLDPNRPKWHWQLFMRELSAPTEACREVVEAFIRPTAHYLREIIGELLPQEMEEIDRIMMCFSIVGQCLYYSAYRPIAESLIGADLYETLTIDRLTDHITRFSLAAIKNGAAPAIAAFPMAESRTGGAS